jgi:hypothetical protein
MLFASSFSDAVEILQTYGPFCGCLLLAVLFFIWRDWKREEKLTDRITNLETEYREVLVPLVTNCTEVIAKNNVIMERVERKLDVI